MRNMYYVDMHCHPALKPFSWTIKRRMKRKVATDPWQVRNVKTSLWYDDPPQRFDRLFNKILTLTKFTQSDLRTLTKGNVKIISASLSPIERGLFTFPGLYFNTKKSKNRCTRSHFCIRGLTAGSTRLRKGKLT